MSESRFRNVFAYGIACAFLASCLGIDEPGQILLFLFGLTYGGLADRSTGGEG